MSTWNEHTEQHEDDTLVQALTRVDRHLLQLRWIQTAVSIELAIITVLVVIRVMQGGG